MAEHRDRPVWNRTKAQWVRSVAITGLVAGGATGLLGAVTVALLRVAGGFIGAYVGGFPTPGFGGAGAAALVVGLTTAGAWGWIGRPRLLPAAAGRTGGDTAGAVLWTGVDSDAADSAADPGPVT